MCRFQTRACINVSNAHTDKPLEELYLLQEGILHKIFLQLCQQEPAFHEHMGTCELSLKENYDQEATDVGYYSPSQTVD